MPDRVKRFFEMHKAGINLFLVIINVLIFQGSECKTCYLLKKSHLRFNCEVYLKT